jgi:hypothetical protein
MAIVIESGVTFGGGVNIGEGLPQLPPQILLTELGDTITTEAGDALTTE